MPGVSRDNDTAGGDLIPSQSTVFANNEEVIIDNDDVAGHGPGAHAAPTIPASINPSVYVENKLAVVKGDPATCAHPATGSGNVWIYEGYAPAVIIPPEVQEALETENNELIENPPIATGDTTGEQVPENYAGTGEAGVDTLGTDQAQVTESLVPSNSQAAADQIPEFLTQILGEAAAGDWDERNNANNNPSISNPNIIGIWSELGIGSSGMWANDQTPWCAGFANWVLKRTGYKYMQSARAYDFRDKTSIYGGTPVPVTEGQPGDIVVWNYSHVNFIYSVPSPGKYTFCGGNQSDKASATNNNPSGGTVSNSYRSGYTPPGKISGIYRPARA